MPTIPRSTRATAGLAVTALLTAPCAASDLVAYSPPIWHGIYAGLHAGGNWTEVTAEPYASSGFQSGAFGGHIGVQTELGPAVFGVEADLDAKTADGSASVAGDFLGYDVSASARAAISANGSVRLRAGVPLASNTLVYATAGYAWATTDVDVSGSIDGDAFTAARGTTVGGLVYGAGVEGFISSNILLRIEALHTDYDDQTLTIPEAGLSGLKIQSSSNVVRAGVSWKFN